MTERVATDASASDTISMLELLELTNNERLGRATAAAERAATALERIADTAEVLTALLDSVIGVSVANCQSSETGETNRPNVNYLRTGDGAPFRCDQTGGDDDE